MLVTTSYNELLDVQTAIKNLNDSNPTIFNKFLKVIKLTRQMQYGYQYMGTLIMDEESDKSMPTSQDDYVLSVYQTEIEKLKADCHFYDLQELLSKYKLVSYKNISRLVLGENPKMLVGPIVIR
ncbi:hypothetical protein [Ornithinibacillus californiensis]|uniref:hypothetical protein n=1 Tax=Ornithinibacillus californiensis TaxID=161536 RepID=UPI00064D8D8A|nr:hypothetical protein [Ornithinibacillus californiensis]